MGMVPRPVGVVPRQIVRRAVRELTAGRLDGIEASALSAGDRVGTASTERVVERPANERAPGAVEKRPPVPPTRAPGKGDERLDDPLELQLGPRMPPLQRSPRRVHALQGPGI